jgi:hypothetical protein
MFTAKQALWAILFGSPFSPYTSAQNVVDTHRNCGAMEQLAHQIALDPAVKTRRERIEAQTMDFVRRRDPSVSERSVITIPVVVHVLYNSTRDNISDAQILSQIDALNRDFRKLNAESANIPSAFQGVAADANIEFCLAKRQPNGLPTSGIERQASSNAAWKANDEMKNAQKGGLNSWDATRYLNIWVCALSGGALGYGTFPGAPLSVDGVVIDYRYFGTYNTRAPFHLGRTATHEVGHWLNLYHIWGDANCGDDNCADTPTHHGANYGCPVYPFIQQNCGGATTEMTMNFMDYTNDACMYLFTNGQKARMLSLFAVGGARRGIVEGNVCGVIQPPLVCATPTNFFVSNTSEYTATVNWTASVDNSTFILDYRRATDLAWTSITNLTSNSLIINNLQPATNYYIRLRARCSNAVESADSPISQCQTLEKIILPPPPPTVDCVDNYEPNNSLSVARFLENNVKTVGMISDIRDKDWFLLKTPTGTALSFKLSGLPADYDMRLYDNKLRLVQSSENQGTTSENFKYTTSAGQDYLLLYIYGYNGAFNANKCYTLEINSLTNGSNLPINATNNSGINNELNSTLIGANNGSNLREKKPEKGIYTEGSFIFPNPTNGVLNIELPTNNAATIQVINTMGQINFLNKNQALDNSNRCSIDLSTLNNGIYFIRIEQDGKTWTEKILKGNE